LNERDWKKVFLFSRHVKIGDNYGERVDNRVLGGVQEGMEE
jgi:hypothetical protein